MNLRRRPVGFLVWNPSRSHPTVQHETYAKAEAEAERLRRENPDDTFWVMSPVASAKAGMTAKAFSDGKAEGYEQAKAEIMLAEARTDACWDARRKLEHQLSSVREIVARATDFRAIVADCQLWFQGFNAAHAHREGYDRPRTPNPDTLRDLNAALGRIERGGDLDDMEIPF